MKLLIVTQVVDTEHPILGFFVRWSLEFAKHCEHVHIICLQEGSHNLPDNVTVHSLGKESGAGRLTYLWRFYKLIWQLRHEYDNVFVHMNQIYVILGAPFWRAWGKRVGLWYTHGTVSKSLRLAEKCTHTIFTASAEGCQMKSDKIMITGHGIDTEHFKPNQSEEKKIDLVTVGRITESKNLLQLVNILGEIRKKLDVSLTIVGATVTAEEQQYEKKLHAHVVTQNLSDQVHFIGRVSQADLPTVLNQSKIFVTVAQNGSLDKVVLEAMACGLPMVSMAPGTQSLGLRSLQTDSTEKFSDAIVIALSKKLSFDQTNRDLIVANHGLTRLVSEKILKELKTELE
jgi:glycosyltransferase involved in cell wall biosynthesis